MYLKSNNNMLAINANGVVINTVNANDPHSEYIHVTIVIDKLLLLIKGHVLRTRFVVP